MARNSEKAMTALARWRAMYVDKVKEKRPYLASECHNLRQAEQWRRQVISEVARKVAQIQNAGLGEYKLRDLNDEINKLLREKGHWDDRIKELGGPDYKKVGPKMLDSLGRPIPGNKGYKYFGAAKELPGVRELFEASFPRDVKKSRTELTRNIDPEYFGYMDDDDGLLAPVELEAERLARHEKIQQWMQEQSCAPT